MNIETGHTRLGMAGFFRFREAQFFTSQRLHRATMVRQPR
jgi:hypothetical protein